MPKCPTVSPTAARQTRPTPQPRQVIIGDAKSKQNPNRSQKIPHPPATPQCVRSKRSNHNSPHRSRSLNQWSTSHNCTTQHARTPSSDQSVSLAGAERLLYGIVLLGARFPCQPSLESEGRRYFASSFVTERGLSHSAALQRVSFVILATIGTLLPAPCTLRI